MTRSLASLPVPPRIMAEPPAVAWLDPAERVVSTLTLDGSLFSAIEAFQTNVDLRLIPVIDDRRRPIGAIFEKDVRRILLSPFGHALLSNPYFGHAIDRHLRPCPVAEADLGIGALIAAYEAASGSEGMILTQGGVLFAAISNRRLITLAARYEAERAQRRTVRAQRIETASHAFEGEIERLVRTLSSLATHADVNAAATAERSRGAGDRAAAVASAALQTNDHMGTIADRGRELATALAGVAHETRAARASAAAAIELVGEGSRRTQDLLRTAQAIDAVVGTIGDIAAQVNLLALNATIEAARAGEAGRGFTVVANAIKGLAMQARAATETIAAQIDEVRHAIGEVVANNADVETAIVAIGARSAVIEQAVGTQAAATHHVAGKVVEVVEASSAITADTAAIADSAANASHSAVEARTLAAQLLAGAQALSVQVDRFLADVRAP